MQRHWFAIAKATNEREPSRFRVPANSVDEHEQSRSYDCGEFSQVYWRSMSTGVEVSGSSSRIIEPFLDYRTVIILEVSVDDLDFNEG
jgi:hypothetical protein